VHACGITHLKKIASLAEMYQVRTGSHGATDLSPVCMAAALHFDLSVHNFGVQEYMRHTPETDRVFPHSYSFENGLMHPGEVPGLASTLMSRSRQMAVRARLLARKPQTRRHHALYLGSACHPEEA
jgi:mannonate dehydratase